MATAVNPYVSKVRWPRVRAFFRRLFKVRAVADNLYGFLRRLPLIPEEQEKQQIENISAYLDAIGKLEHHLQGRGYSATEIRTMLDELEVPLFQSMMDAMCIRREFSKTGHLSLKPRQGAPEDEPSERAAGAVD